jgi:hypothetical protein
MVRDTLQTPANLRDFLRDALPDVADRLDYAKMRPLEREIVGGDWRVREADLLFEIPYLQSPHPPALIAVLVEHQSDTDPLIPLRTLLMTTGYWERVWRDWEAKPRPRDPLRLPPVVPIVLYTADVPWGSNEELADLLGPPEVLHAFAPGWKPVFWNLAERTPERLLAGGPWMQLMTVMRVSVEEQAEIERLFTEAVRRLNTIRDIEHVRWYELLRAMFYYVSWRRPSLNRQVLEAILVRENPANQQEVQGMIKTGAEELMEEGAVRATRALLLKMLEDQFAPVPDVLRQQIGSIRDVERLQRAVLRAARLEKLEDLNL